MYKFLSIFLAGLLGIGAVYYSVQASTITTLQGSDTLSASRSVINQNFQNLNTDKFELTSWYGTTTWAGGDNSLTVGGSLKASGVFNASSTAHVTGNLTVGSLAGSGTSCLQVSNTGLLSATGAACGSGGGGGSSDISIFTVGGQKYLAASSSDYNWLTRNSGIIAKGSSTFSGNVSLGTIVSVLNASSTAHVTGDAMFGDDAAVTGYLRVGSLSAPSASTDGDITAVRLALGTAPSLDTTRIIDARIVSTATANGATIPFNFLNTIQPASDSSSDFRALNFQNTLDAAAGVHLDNIEAAHFEGGRFGTTQSSKITSMKGGVFWGATQASGAVGTSTVTSIWGIQAIGINRTSGTGAIAATTTIGLQAQAIGSSSFATTTDAIGIDVNGNGTGNKITNAYGIDVDSQTSATKKAYGIRIAAPEGAANNYALNLSDTGGTSAGGITFGTDTNLYRLSANTLKTDDSFNASSTMHTGTTTVIGLLTVDNHGTGTSTATFGSVTRKSCFNTFASDGTQINTTWDLNGITYTRVGAC